MAFISPYEGGDLTRVFFTDYNLIDQYVGYTAWSWGANNTGQLGLGDTTNRSSPVQVGALTNWQFIAANGICSAATKTDGTLWTWGNNGGGQLGLNDIVSRSSPVQVGSLTNWKQVACGYAFMLAIKTDQTLWAWGTNTGVGALGLGDRTNRSSPVQVGSLTNWKQVAGGQQTSAAIKLDGTLWTWGDNYYGQLGDGTTISKSSPIQVGSLTNWKQIMCGFRHVLAIKTDGTLWAWGNNDAGQLGLNDIVSRSSPVQVGLLTNWKQVSAGGGAVGSGVTAAIKMDGTLWAWGNNNAGQLGLNDIVSRSSPVQVGLLTNWKQVACNIAAVSTTMAAVKTDGSLWTCGYNAVGQLGLGDRTSRSSPVQVGALTIWKQVLISTNSTIAVTFGD